MFSAGIADDHVEVIEQGHGGDVFGQSPSPDQQHPVLRPEDVGQCGPIEDQCSGSLGRGQCHVACVAIHRALHQLTRLQLLDQGIERRQIWGEFQQQFQRATTGQAEAVRLVSGDAVAHQFRCRLR